ncbi:MAG: homogentisate 1,2-dioxygenase, partial [Angustibacter sp.]
MAYYRSVGEIPPKRHTQFRRPDGGLYSEELMGEEGFSSDSSLLYHREIPSAMSDARVWDDLPDLTTTPNHPLRPFHFKLHELFPGDAPGQGLDVVRHRRLVLGNGDVRISYAVSDSPSPYYRNAIGDECVFVESGAATVETVFGALEARQGDFVVIPRATVHRWVPKPDAGPLRAYCIEASSHIGPPKRYLSKYGQLLEHSPYCERDLHGPTEPLLVEGSDVEVYTKHRGNGPHGIVGSIVVHASHPFDVVGWDGCMYPYTFNVEDYEPITGRIHQPPPVHQVFEGWNFVICAFVPRKVDYHPLAVPVPYYHSNVDSDEVM